MASDDFALEEFADSTALATPFVRSKVLPPAPPPQNNSVYDWDIWVARLSQ